MINETSVARPYAIAAYETAVERHELQSWADLLAALAPLVQQPMLIQLFLNPSYSSEMLADVCIALVTKTYPSLSQEQINFIRLLSEADKLPLLDDVNEIFGHLRSIFNDVVDITVTSAQALTDDYKDKLKAALQVRYKQGTHLTFNEDPSLVAGILIRAGDHVIDGTVKTQLQRVREALKVGTCN